MRQFSNLIVILLAVLCFSCQKEIGDGTGSGGGTNGTRLIRTGTRSGADSITLDYSYNSSGKLTGYILSGSQGGQAVDLKIRLVRSGSGIIQQVITKSDQFILFGIDSVITKVNYDAANNRYHSAVTSISIFGFTFKDSILYQYDASGRVITDIDYADDGTGGGYAPAGKNEYTYTGANLATEKSYSYDDVTSAYVLDETSTFEYDTKINPIQFASDAPVLGISGFYSANNTTKTTVVASDPTNNSMTTDTYTYNSANRPQTAVSVTGTDTSVSTFYYQ